MAGFYNRKNAVRLKIIAAFFLLMILGGGISASEKRVDLHLLKMVS